jgi:hypothetical protein
VYMSPPSYLAKVIQLPYLAKVALFTMSVLMCMHCGPLSPGPALMLWK